MKCDNGKWKWGQNGECVYDSREDCEEANEGKHSLKKNKDIRYFQAEFKAIPKEGFDGKLSDVTKEQSKLGTVITGYASTPDVDRYNDVVEPGAFTDSITDDYKSNPIVLFQHDPYRPIGKATYMAIDSNGLYIEAVIVDAEIEPKIQAGILRAFSIGYIPEEIEYRDKDGNLLDEEMDILRILFDSTVKRTIKRLDLVENSVVSLPANPKALFTMEKSFNAYFDDVISQKFFKETKDAIIFNGMKSESGEPMIFYKKDWDIESVKQHLKDLYKSKSLTKKEMAISKKEEETTTPATPPTEPEKVETAPVTETDSGEKPAETEGSETSTEGEKVEETTPPAEEAPAVETPKEEDKPAEENPEDKGFIKAEVAIEAVKKVHEELDATKKKLEVAEKENVELKSRLEKLPAKQGLAYVKQEKFADGVKKEETTPDQKSGFIDALKTAAN